MDCVVYATEELANAGALRNWINYVKEQVTAERPAETAEGELIYSLDGLTDEEIGALKLPGWKKGVLVPGAKATERFITPVPALDGSGIWYYPLPAERYMIDVTDYEILPFNPAWIGDGAET